jgi:MOSC N-terminal beta barrel domain
MSCRLAGLDGTVVKRVGMGPFDHAEPGGLDAQLETGKVSQLFITDRGGLGDRAWALRDPTNGRIASAKRFPQLLEFRAIYEVEPTMTTSGRVRIEAHRMLKACTPTSHAPRS